MIHCHILEDSDEGMMALFNVVGKEGTEYANARKADPKCYSPTFGARGGDWEETASNETPEFPLYGSILITAIGGILLGILIGIAVSKRFNIEENVIEVSNKLSTETSVEEGIEVKKLADAKKLSIREVLMQKHVQAQETSMHRL